MKRLSLLGLMLLLIVIAVSGFQNEPPPPPVFPQITPLPTSATRSPADAPADAPPGFGADVTNEFDEDALVVRVVNGLNALPLFAAQAAGLFTLADVEVVIAPTINQAVLEQTTLQADDRAQIVLTDLAVVLRLNAEGADLRVVRDLTPTGGLNLTLDDGNTLQVIAVRAALLEAEPEQVELFLSAIDTAADAINRDPDAFRPLIDRIISSPISVSATLPIPNFPAGLLPTEEAVQTLIDALIAAGELPATVAYADLIDARFIPDAQP